MVNDLYSFINENPSIANVNVVGNDLRECKKFYTFLLTDLKLNETTVKRNSEIFFKSKKHLLKNVFKTSANLDEMSLNLANIYAKIFSEFADEYGYKHIDSLRRSIRRLQYKATKTSFAESTNNYAQMN